jgi:L-ribulose-5-phosphate 3-epimerase
MACGVEQDACSGAPVYAAINGWTFSDCDDPAAQLALARAAGLMGLELVVSATGPLRPDTPPDEFARLADCAAAAGVQLTSIATGLFWQANYASPAPDDRARAAALTETLLAQAAAARAGAILVVPAVVGRAADPRPGVPYSVALERTATALASLRHVAEDAGVTIALENVWNRFLLSPVEAAALVDHVNSPCVGWYFDVGNVLATGYPEDWITTLGRRIARVHIKDYDLARPGSAGFCPLGEGSVDWPGVMGALREIGYDGPLVYEGAGEVAEIGRRMQRLIAGQPPVSRAR